MTNKNVLPADSYTVVNKTILKSDVNNLLFMLYQPIVGSDAINLYLTLVSYLDTQNIASKKWTHHQLMSSTMQDLPKLIYARERLEAIGLLKTFFKKGDLNDFVYELFSPLDAYDFFQNPLLSTTLYNNIGEEDFNRVVEHFKIPSFDLSGYDDISCNFSDIYEVKEFLNIDKYIYGIRKKNKLDLSLSHDINIDDIISTMPDDIINKKRITKGIKELLYKLSYTYDLDSTVVKNIIHESIDLDKNIDKDVLRKKARSYYKFENTGKLPSIIDKNQPDYLKSNTTVVSNRQKIIYQFENTTPYNYLKLRNKGGRPNNLELKLVEELLVDYKMQPGVVNVLIDFVLRTNNNKLTKNFVLAIASQWVKSDINTVEDAMAIAVNEKKKKKEYKRKDNKKQVDKPSWVDKELEEETMEIDEQKRIEEIFKKYE